MTIEGQITIMCAADEVTIDIHDQQASVDFVTVRMSPENFVAALGRLAYVPCELNVGALNRVGLVHECRDWEFPMPPDVSWKKKKETAMALAKKLCPEGWTPDTHFGSQDSFYRVGEQQMARTMIRRWVPRTTNTAGKDER